MQWLQCIHTTSHHVLRHGHLLLLHRLHSTKTLVTILLEEIVIINFVWTHKERIGHTEVRVGALEIDVIVVGNVVKVEYIA